MEPKARKGERGCAANRKKIDFLGYTFEGNLTMLRKSIKKNFAKKEKIKDKEKRHKALASYWGWCKHGNCRHLWKKITHNDMSFADRGIKSNTTTKDGKRYFDDPEKKMSEILNLDIEVLDFETGINTRMGPDRYAIRFAIIERGERNLYKVITNSHTLKSVLDQAKSYDMHLAELKDIERAAKDKYGEKYDSDKLNLTEEEQKMLNDSQPMFPQFTSIHRRDLGGGKYDYYFD